MDLDVTNLDTTDVGSSDVDTSDVDTTFRPAVAARRDGTALLATLAAGTLLFVVCLAAAWLVMKVSFDAGALVAVVLPPAAGFAAATRLPRAALVSAGLFACIAGVALFAGTRRYHELEAGPFLRAPEVIDGDALRAATRLRIGDAVLRRDLAGWYGHTTTDNKGQVHASRTWCSIPLVPADWDPREPVAAWVHEVHASGFESRVDRPVPVADVGLVIVAGRDREYATAALDDALRRHSLAAATAPALLELADDPENAGGAALRRCLWLCGLVYAACAMHRVISWWRRPRGAPSAPRAA